MVGEHQRNRYCPQAIESGNAGLALRTRRRTTPGGRRTKPTRDGRYPTGSSGTRRRRGLNPGRFGAGSLRVLAIWPTEAVVGADTSMSLSVENQRKLRCDLAAQAQDTAKAAAEILATE